MNMTKKRKYPSIVKAKSQQHIFCKTKYTNTHKQIASSFQTSVTYLYPLAPASFTVIATCPVLSAHYLNSGRAVEKKRGCTKHTVSAGFPSAVVY